MIRVELSELPEHDLHFEVAPRGVDRPGHGGQDAPVGYLADRIRLGGPICVPITPRYVEQDAELRAFVEQEAGRFAYHLVHLAVTCVNRPDDPPIDEATVALMLSSSRGAAPTAWSMAPQRVTGPSEVSDSWRLEPTLKLGEVEGSLGSIGRSVTRAGQDNHVLALNELRSDPLWQLRRTDAIALDGQLRLILVVRSPWGVVSTVAGTVTGTTRHRRFLHTETAALPWPLEFTAEF